MRLLPHALVVLVVVLTGGCLSPGGSEEPGTGSAELDREGFERLRSQAETLGTEAFAAAAEAVGATGELPGSGSAGATSCSGAPDGVVRITMGTSLQYDPPTPNEALERVVSVWERLGLEVVEDDGGLNAETTVEGARVSLVLDRPAAMQDGSEQELRGLSLRSECVDIGADLAREVR